MCGCVGLRTSFAVAVSMSGVVRATVCGAESDCPVSMYPPVIIVKATMLSSQT